MPKRVPDYDAANRQAAKIILSDPAKHGGPDSLAVQWATLYLQRHPEIIRQHQGSKSLRQRQVGVGRVA